MSKRKTSLPENFDALSLGEAIAFLRKRKGIRVEQAARHVGVSARRLRVLETGSPGDLPAPVYARGYLARYASILDVPPDVLLEKYERVVDGRSETAQHRALPRLSGVRVVLRFKSVVVVAVVLFFVFAGGYVLRQSMVVFASPALEIEAPVEDVVVGESAVTISGVTDPEARLTINGQAVYPDEEGNFEEAVILKEGLNVIEVSAVNGVGKRSVVTRRILYSNSQ